MAAPGARLLVLGAVVAIPGIVLVLIGHGWSLGVGVAVLLLGSIPATIGLGLIVASVVSRWAARRKPFA